MKDRNEINEAIECYCNYETVKKDAIIRAKLNAAKQVASENKLQTLLHRSIILAVLMAILMAIIGICSDNVIAFYIMGAFLFLGIVEHIIVSAKYQGEDKLKFKRAEAEKIEIDKSLANLEEVKCKEIDAMMSDFISDEELYDMAINKIGVDSEDVVVIDPIYLSGYYFDAIQGIDYKPFKGEDGTYRSTSYEKTVLLFSETQIFMYSYRFSVKANATSEKSDEYFYTDIVSATTDSREIKLINTDSTYTSIDHKKNGVGNVNNAVEVPTFSTEYFRLTTSGGTSLSCSIIASDEATQQSITAMKHLIREKKRG